MTVKLDVVAIWVVLAAAGALAVLLLLVLVMPWLSIEPSRSLLAPSPPFPSVELTRDSSLKLQLSGVSAECVMFAAEAQACVLCGSSGHLALACNPAGSFSPAPNPVINWLPEHWVSTAYLTCE